MYEIDYLFKKPPETIAVKGRAFLELTTLSRLDLAPILTFDPTVNPQIDLDRFGEGTVLRRKTVNTPRQTKGMIGM